MTFQERVKHWMLAVFLRPASITLTKRLDRFVEEAAEFLQSKGYPKARAIALLDHVYRKPVGEPTAEAGAVMVTFAAACSVAGIDIHAAGEAEMARVSHPDLVARIRSKEATEDEGSPLPGRVEAAENSGTYLLAALRRPPLPEARAGDGEPV